MKHNKKTMIAGESCTKETPASTTNKSQIFQNFEWHTLTFASLKRPFNKTWSLTTIEICGFLKGLGLSCSSWMRPKTITFFLAHPENWAIKCATWSLGSSHTLTNPQVWTSWPHAMKHVCTKSVVAKVLHLVSVQVQWDWQKFKSFQPGSEILRAGSWATPWIFTESIGTGIREDLPKPDCTWNTLHLYIFLCLLEVLNYLAWLKQSRSSLHP